MSSPTRQSRSWWSCGLFGSSSKQSLRNQIDNLREEIDNDQRQIKKLETQIGQLQNDLDDAITKSEKLTENNSVLEKEVQRQEEKIKKFTKTKSDLEKKVKEKDEQIETLTKTISDLEKKVKEKDEQIETLTKTISDLEKKVKEKDEQIETLAANEATLKKAVNDRDVDIQTLAKTKSDSEKVVKEKDEQIKTLKDEFQREKQLIADYYSGQLQSKEEEIQIKAVEIQSLNSEILQKDHTIKQLIRQRDEERTAKEEERRQKDEALTRLSAVAGDRLRNNNPGITDLSDPNRPMKIAEKFTEMYDNDWTDAMEALEELKIEEDQCVEVLLHFLTDAYEECERKVLELDSHLVKAVTLTVFENGCKETDVSEQSKQSLPAELTKPIRDLRKTFTTNCVDELQKKIPQLLKEKRQLTDEHMKACEHFIADCIKYAWMMQIQDPPVHIEWKFQKGSKIDTNILRSYTKAGDLVDFVVWPVLYLHKGGPVLNKGVVQPLQIKE